MCGEYKQRMTCVMRILYGLRGMRGALSCDADADAAAAADASLPICSTCSLTCITRHKRDTSCEGRRPKSAFIPVNEMNDDTLMRGE